MNPQNSHQSPPNAGSNAVRILKAIFKRTYYVALFLCFVVNGFAQTVGWAVKGGGSGNDVGLGVAHDANGNIFVTGYFTGSASFGSTNLSSAGSNDVFLAKYDAAGNLVWAKQFGSVGDDQGLAIAVTASNEIVISGIFNSTVSFGASSVSSSGNYDMFVCKLDNNGNALWAKRGGGSGGDYGWSVACNDGGSIFVGGSFSSATASFGSTTLTSSGGTDVFVAEYDASGNFIQAKNAGSSGEDLAYAIHTHGAHTCLYLAGRFSGNASFSGNTIVSSGAEDAFVAHFELSTGVFDWVRKMGGSGSESAQGVSTDADCNVYVAGKTLMKLVYDIQVNDCPDVIENRISSVKAEEIKKTNIIESNKYYESQMVNSVLKPDQMYSNKQFLGNNYPNPHNGQTIIPYFLNSESTGIISLFDVNGLRIREYYLQKGRNNLILNENDLAAGIYLYKMTVNEELLETKRMTIIK